MHINWLKHALTKAIEQSKLQQSYTDNSVGYLTGVIIEASTDYKAQ